jgi:hypothetical protein
MSAADQLLEDLRTLYRRPHMNAPAADAYRTALAAMPQIPERQRDNVYDHTLYTNTGMSDAIDAAIWRETTRVVQFENDGLRVETVRGLCSEHYCAEVYDDFTTTSCRIASCGGIPAAWLDRTATKLFTEVWQRINTEEPACDGCYVRVDGRHYVIEEKPTERALRSGPCWFGGYLLTFRLLADGSVTDCPVPEAVPADA